VQDAPAPSHRVARLARSFTRAWSDLPRGRRRIGLAASVLLVVVGALLIAGAPGAYPFPSDHTPEGAYMRIAERIAAGEPAGVFPYLETDAQWACFTIKDLRAQASVRIQASFPAEERARATDPYRAEASAADGPDVFLVFAERRGWIGRLRRDLSGVAQVDVEGERASVVTARGTRYPFRRRDNGIWGLTLFTADLVAEAEKAARDLSVVTQAADDYDRGNGARDD
jgi:hypothetical protein